MRRHDSGARELPLEHRHYRNGANAIVGIERTAAARAQAIIAGDPTTPAGVPYGSIFYL